MWQKPSVKPALTHPAVCVYLDDVLHIELHIKGEFNVVVGEDALLHLTVAAQATEGAGVARLLLVDATKNNNKPQIQRQVFKMLFWKGRAALVIVCMCAADRNSMTGVKSMVMSAGRPGMSGMMEVSLSKKFAPANKLRDLKLQKNWAQKKKI